MPSAASTASPTPTVSSIAMTTTPSRLAAAVGPIAASGAVLSPPGPAGLVVDPARPTPGMSVDPTAGAEEAGLAAASAGDPVVPGAGPRGNPGASGAWDADALPSGVRLDGG